MSGLGGKVAIIGTDTIKFGENFHQSLSDMIWRTARRVSRLFATPRWQWRLASTSRAAIPSAPRASG
jgi:hypothetical protein